MVNKQLFTVEPAQSKEMEVFQMLVINQVETAEKALSLMVTFSGLTHESLASEVGKPRETITRFLNGNGGLTYQNFKRLINASGNLMLLQVLAKDFGYELTPINQKEKRRAEIIAELQALENAA